MSYLRSFRPVLALLVLLASSTTWGGNAPALQAIQPDGGNVAGGNSVLLSGINLSAITSVTFDGLPAAILRQDANSLYVTAPAHAAGAVTVNAYVADRAIAGTPSLDFTYSDDFDASRDFSAVQNPAGAWTYGVAPALGQAIGIDAATGIDGCLDTWSGDNLHPVVGRNRTSATCNQYSWSWPAGMIGLHPDNTPEYGVIRFTAPETGRYLVDGRFLCIDNVVSCTVHVAIQHNQVTLLERSINTSFAPEAFSFEIELSLGDWLDFTQGNGGNHYNYDQMVMHARIRPAALFSDGFEQTN